MAADLEWLDTMRSRGWGRRVSPEQLNAESTGPSTTFFTSGVRLAGAIQKMASAQTIPALIAIKDAAKPTLLERDFPALKTAYETRYQYLRSIPTTTDIYPNQE